MSLDDNPHLTCSRFWLNLAPRYLEDCGEIDALLRKVECDFVSAWLSSSPASNSLLDVETSDRSIESNRAHVDLWTRPNLLYAYSTSHSTPLQCEFGSRVIEHHCRAKLFFRPLRFAQLPTFITQKNSRTGEYEREPGMQFTHITVFFTAMEHFLSLSVNGSSLLPLFMQETVQRLLPYGLLLCAFRVTANDPEKRIERFVRLAEHLSLRCIHHKWPEQLDKHFWWQDRLTNAAFRRLNPSPLATDLHPLIEPYVFSVWQLRPQQQ